VDERILESLLFPKEVHTRSPDPGPYAHFSSYKPHLQTEFRRKCVYCRASDGPIGVGVFGVDHYLPKSKFPLLAHTWSNLFYACYRCNTLKSSFVSTPELFLPNSCEHRMAEHLQYEGVDVVTFTEHGDCMAELLRLREEDRRKRRDCALAALRDFLVDHNNLCNKLTSYEVMLEKGQGNRKVLEVLIQEASEELEQVKSRIELLIGESLSKP
jgi:HNH endonuclease